MFDLEKYLHDLIGACKASFCDRLLYVGLQGSYLRGEAHDNSDIDVMVVVENLSVADMDRYREILLEIGFYEKSCGFLCGRAELACWNPLEICQLLHTTKDLYGSLKELLPHAARADEINYVKLSLGNLYHELCHRYVHADKETNEAVFGAVCKNFFFLIQNLYYLESGRFVLSKKELKECVCECDRVLLELGDKKGKIDFESSFALAFAWCQETFGRLNKINEG